MIHRRQLLQRSGMVTAAGIGGLFARPATAQTQAPSPGAGYQFTSLPFGGGGFVDGFVYHPLERGLLYCRTDIGGAYRFDAVARRWQPLMDHLGRDDADLMSVLSLAIDPQASRRLYAACGTYTGEWARKAALLASDDRGATWRTTELGFKLGGNEDGRGSGERLQVDPHLGERLLLGSTQDGLWQSLDRGRSFSRLDFAPRHVSLVLFEARDGTPGSATRSVWVGSHDQPGLWVSRDAGRSFARAAGAPAMAPQRAAFAADGTLYVAFAAGAGATAVCNPGHAQRGGVWKRSPDGRWSEITPVKPGVGGASGFGYSGLDVDARTPGRLVVSTLERWSEGDEVFLSTDGGASWTALGARSRHDTRRHPWLASYTQGQDRMGHWISDIKLDPHDPDGAVYGTGFGLWLTRNLGAAQRPADAAAPTLVQWQFEVDNLEETVALSLKSPTGGATLLAAMGDVSGGAWEEPTKAPATGLFVPTHETNRSVDVAELQPGVVARVADGAATGGYWSPDGGASWRAFGATPPALRPVKTAQGATIECGRIAVSAKGGFFLWVPEKQAALCSRDKGRSWALCEGWPADRTLPLEPVADRAVEGVFHVHDKVGGRVLTSVDGGQSFKPSISGLPELRHWQTSQLLSVPGAMRELWLAMPEGLMHLPGLDRPSRTIAGVSAAWLIALGKGAPGGTARHSLFLWGQMMSGGQATDGLYRSDDNGASWRRLNSDAHRFGRLVAMAADPLEHGTVYIAPHGRGVLAGRPAAA